ncbi:MAG: hypothetical protein RLQ73_05250 [Hoeflea sp. D1-CHI-28]
MALSNAERQRRYRQRLKARAAKVVSLTRDESAGDHKRARDRIVSMTDRLSRVQQELMHVMSRIEISADPTSEAGPIIADLRRVLDDAEAWRDGR